jgi:hypothetical protein
MRNEKRHDIQHIDTQYNNIQHNTQHNGIRVFLCRVSAMLKVTLTHCNK